MNNFLSCAEDAMNMGISFAIVPINKRIGKKRKMDGKQQRRPKQIKRADNLQERVEKEYAKENSNGGKPCITEGQ